MSRTQASLAVFGLLLAALTFTIVAGIWTGDSRWLATAWIPGSLATVMFCFMPVILGWHEL